MELTALALKNGPEGISQKCGRTVKYANTTKLQNSMS